MQAGGHVVSSGIYLSDKVTGRMKYCDCDCDGDCKERQQHTHKHEQEQEQEHKKMQIGMLESALTSRLRVRMCILGTLWPLT